MCRSNFKPSTLSQSSEGLGLVWREELAYLRVLVTCSLAYSSHKAPVKENVAQIDAIKSFLCLLVQQTQTLLHNVPITL